MQLASNLKRKKDEFTQEFKSNLNPLSQTNISSMRNTLQTVSPKIQQFGQNITAASTPDFTKPTLKNIVKTPFQMAGTLVGGTLTDIGTVGKVAGSPESLKQMPNISLESFLDVNKPSKASVGLTALGLIPFGIASKTTQATAKALKPFLSEIRTVRKVLGEVGDTRYIDPAQLRVAEELITKVKGSNAIVKMRELNKLPGEYTDSIRALLNVTEDQILNPGVDFGLSVKKLKRQDAQAGLYDAKIKITDRLDKLEGIEKTYFNPKDRSITVYYDEKIPKDTINVRVQKMLQDVGLGRDIEKINLLSTEKGTFSVPQQLLSEPVITSKGGKIKLRVKPVEEVPQAEGLKRISLQGETPTKQIKSMPSSQASVMNEKVPLGTKPSTLIQEATQKQSKVSGSEALPDIISKEPIDVKSKVGLLDYLRTPDRVLKKIGMEKESALIRQKYNDYLDQLPKEIDKITEWSKKVSPDANQRIFKYLDGQDVPISKQELAVANEIKAYLSGWADKLGLPKEKRITNYITHIFEKDFIKKEFDPEIAKLIQNRVAGSVYDPFTEQRLGKMGYVEDTWRALDAYVKRATRKVNMDIALEQVKDKAKTLETSQYNYVKQYIDRINLRPTEIDNLIDNTIKQLVGYRFGQRPVSSLARTGRQMVYRGTLGLNPGSALKNLSQGANTYAKLGERYTIKGYWDILTKGSKELQDVGVLRDNFIQDRTISAGKQLLQKLDKGLFVFFDGAEKINRGAAYFGAKAKALNSGLSEEEAIQAGLKMVRDTQFTFGSVDTPPILSSDISKLLLQFQSYSLKQGEFLGEMIANKEFAGLIRYALAGTAFVYTMGKLIGMKPKDLIPSFRIGLPPTLQTPIEIGKAIIGTPDEYGNELDAKQRLQNVGKSLIPFIPAGTQIKKTVEGLTDVSKGVSETAKGNIRYPVAQTAGNYIRGGLFGRHNLPEAQEYYKEKRTPLSEKQSEFVRTDKSKLKENYQTIIDTRAKNVEEEKVKKIVEEQQGGVQETQDKYYYWDSETSAVKSVNKEFTPTIPESTGIEELDKLAVSSLKSDITARMKELSVLLDKGLITQEEASKQVGELVKLKTALSTPKKAKVSKPRYVALKFGKRKKITGLTKSKGVKLIKAPKLKTVKL